MKSVAWSVQETMVQNLLVSMAWTVSLGEKGSPFGACALLAHCPCGLSTGGTASPNIVSSGSNSLQPVPPSTGPEFPDIARDGSVRDRLP